MSSPEDKVAEDAAEEAPAGRFLLRKIYLKDASFEAPSSPGVFQPGEWNPNVDLHMDNSARKIEQDLYEVTITATVTVTVGAQVAYLVEVTQAGMFQITGFSNEKVKESLGTECPSILFPFVREVVTDLATKGGFPQLLLAPMNFQVLYQKHLGQQAH